MLINSALTVFGLIILVLGADIFVDRASKIASKKNVSPFLIGAVIIGFGTSLPELLISSNAALRGQLPLAIGNVVGSNTANIGLILGVGLLLTKVVASERLFRRQVLSLVATGFAAWVLCMDGALSRLDALVLLACFCLSFFALRESNEEPHRLDTPSADSIAKLGLVLVISGIAMVGGAELLVRCAQNLARDLGVSELVIGICVLAVGSSLPELAATIASARRGQGQMILGNIVGSNLLNLCFVLPIAVLLGPGDVPRDALWRDFPVMFLLTTLCLIFGIIGRGTLNRLYGVVFLVIYSMYIGYIGLTL